MPNMKPTEFNPQEEAWKAAAKQRGREEYLLAEFMAQWAQDNPEEAAAIEKIRKEK